MEEKKIEKLLFISTLRKNHLNLQKYTILSFQEKL